MKSEPIFFTKDAVINFLGNHGRPGTKDYEFAAALIIHRFCERQWGNDCWLGFRIKPEYSNSLPAYNSERPIGLAEIAELFRKGVDEDSPVDFVVAKRANMNKARGMVFQVKRFGIGRNKKDTDELVSYLNSFSRKYGKTDANLLIMLDDGVSVDVSKLQSEFDTNNFPFNRIIFSWINEGLVYIQDIYPSGNREFFPVTDLYSSNSVQFGTKGTKLWPWVNRSPRGQTRGAPPSLKLRMGKETETPAAVPLWRDATERGKFML